MDPLPRPRRAVAARILSIVVIVPMLIAACSGSPLGGGSSSDPTGVVKDALAKVSARDVNGLAALACAGQADKIKQQFDMGGALGSELPSGVDTQAIIDSVTIDTSGATIGTPTVSGDSATVPLTGTMKVTIDKEKIRPIIKQMMEAQLGSIAIPDAQIDQMIDAFGGNQSIPLNESLTLKKENGAWKICEPSDGSDGAAPSAS